LIFAKTKTHKYILIKTLHNLNT